MESQNGEPPQGLRYQSRSRRRRSSSSRHDGHKVYPVTLNDSAPSHSLSPRPHLEQFIISSFRHRPFSARQVSRNGGTRTRTERHLKPTPLPNWATFRPAPGVTRGQSTGPRLGVVDRFVLSNRSADGAGFGPAEPLGSPVFKTGALDRSANHPCLTFSPAAQATARTYTGFRESTGAWRKAGGRIGFYRQRRGQRCLSYAPSGRAIRSGR